MCVSLKFYVYIYNLYIYRRVCIDYADHVDIEGAFSLDKMCEHHLDTVRK